jgi:hypothetical protein
LKSLDRGFEKLASSLLEFIEYKGLIEMTEPRVMRISNTTMKKMGYEMPKKIQFEWELPDGLVDAIAQDTVGAVRTIKEAAVLDWVRTHRVSTRRGSELLQMPYRAFLELMAAHRIPAMDYEEGWLEREREFLQPGSGTNSL